MKKPILIVTLGFPGSGKTYFSERLAKEMDYIHLNSDRTRFTLFETPTFTRAESIRMFNLMDHFAGECLKKGVSVIYDANVNFREHRKRLRKLAEKCGADYKLIWIKTDVPVAEKRLLKRKNVKGKDKQLIYRPLDIEILHLVKNQMQEPPKSEHHIVIDGHLPFSKQYQAFRLGP